MYFFNALLNISVDKSEFIEQMARVSERNSGAPAKGRKNIDSEQRELRVAKLNATS